MILQLCITWGVDNEIRRFLRRLNALKFKSLTITGIIGLYCVEVLVARSRLSYSLLNGLCFRSLNECQHGI